MRVVIVGGGMAGLVLARGLLHRGVAPVVLERMPSAAVVEGPIMLPFQAYGALQEIGLLEGIRAAGRDVPPHRDGLPVSIGVGRQLVLERLREGVDIRWEHELVDLLRDGERVTGVRARGPGGEMEIPAGIVVGADGTHSRVRDLAGIPHITRPSEGGGLSFTSPVVMPSSFVMAYQSDGRQVGVMSWPGGSAGWWQIDRIGREAALAPGLEAFKRSFTRLLPPAELALEGVTSMDQVRYREITEVVSERWWNPGVMLIGEAAHAMDPESGVGAGLGFGDALQLAKSIAANPDDPDEACRHHEHWRRPVVDPYVSVGAQGARIPQGPPGSQRPPWEYWPPREF